MKYIVIEGYDGVGKTTYLNRWKEQDCSNNTNIIYIAEKTKIDRIHTQLVLNEYKNTHMTIVSDRSFISDYAYDYKMNNCEPQEFIAQNKINYLPDEVVFLSYEDDTKLIKVTRKSEDESHTKALESYTRTMKRYHDMLRYLEENGVSVSYFLV